MSPLYDSIATKIILLFADRNKKTYAHTRLYVVYDLKKKFARSTKSEGKINSQLPSFPEPVPCSKTTLIKQNNTKITFTPILLAIITKKQITKSKITKT